MNIFTNFTVAVALIFLTVGAPTTPVTQDAVPTITVHISEGVTGHGGNAPVLPSTEKA